MKIKVGDILLKRNFDHSGAHESAILVEEILEDGSDGSNWAVGFMGIVVGCDAKHPKSELNSKSVYKLSPLFIKKLKLEDLKRFNEFDTSHKLIRGKRKMLQMKVNDILKYVCENEKRGFAVRVTRYMKDEGNHHFEGVVIARNGECVHNIGFTSKLWDTYEEWWKKIDLGQVASDFEEIDQSVVNKVSAGSIMRYVGRGNNRDPFAIEVTSYDSNANKASGRVIARNRNCDWHIGTFCENWVGLSDPAYWSPSTLAEVVTDFDEVEELPKNEIKAGTILAYKANGAGEGSFAIRVTSYNSDNDMAVGKVIACDAKNCQWKVSSINIHWAGLRNPKYWEVIDEFAALKYDVLDSEFAEETARSLLPRSYLVPIPGGCAKIPQEKRPDNFNDTRALWFWDSTERRWEVGALGNATAYYAVDTRSDYAQKKWSKLFTQIELEISLDKPKIGDLIWIPATIGKSGELISAKVYWNKASGEKLPDRLGIVVGHYHDGKVINSRDRVPYALAYKITGAKWSNGASAMDAIYDALIPSSE